MGNLTTLEALLLMAKFRKMAKVETPFALLLGMSSYPT